MLQIGGYGQSDSFNTIYILDKAINNNFNKTLPLEKNCQMHFQVFPGISLTLQIIDLVHVPNFFFGGVAGSENFTCATLLTTPFDFQGKNLKFLSPYPPKNQIKDNCHSPPQKNGQSQNYGASINSNGLLTL